MNGHVCVCVNAFTCVHGNVHIFIYARMVENAYDVLNAFAITVVSKNLLCFKYKELGSQLTASCTIFPTDRREGWDIW